MMTSTVHDVALVFEGGGMRNSYSAGAISVMLEQGLFFDDVYGLSAGATNAIDYVSRDARRNKASFTVCLDDLSFRWWVTPFVDTDGVSAALHGDARVRSSCALPFDFDAFQANPARVTLQAIPSCCSRRSSTDARCTTAASDGAAASWCRARWTMS